MSGTNDTCARSRSLHHLSDEIRVAPHTPEIAPLEPSIARVRQLVSGLELCHHKAERWVENIIEAIGAGATTKGLGTRSPGRRHPAEVVWQQACAALSAWCAGCPPRNEYPGRSGLDRADVMVVGAGQRRDMRLALYRMD